MSERYFAIINPSNLITSVVLMDASSEEEGIQKVKDSHNNQNLNIKETWKDASDASKRYNYATIGGTWDNTNSAFIGLRPFDSWTLDSNYRWQPPTAYPSNKTYSEDIAVYWNESNTRWEGTNQSGDLVATWNALTSSWDSL